MVSNNLASHMGSRIVLAVDCMGGDDGPSVSVGGADLLAQERQDVDFVFFGEKSRIEPLVSSSVNLRDRCSLIESDYVLPSDVRPAYICRMKPGSSMEMAIEYAASGNASAVVSAGDTGMLMILSRKHFGMIEGIARPAISAVFPSRGGHGRCVALDLGANVECSDKMLFAFAVMGVSYVKSFLDITKPRVGFLNIGSEAHKGKDEIKSAVNMFNDVAADLDVESIGYVEPKDIFFGQADVVVTDGFTGNLVLKSIEATAHFMSDGLSVLGRQMFCSDSSQVSSDSARELFYNFLNQVDCREKNGAPLLGIKGISVKSHGAADKTAFASALRIAIYLAVAHADEDIEERMNISKKVLSI